MYRVGKQDGIALKVDQFVSRVGVQLAERMIGTSMGERDDEPADVAALQRDTEWRLESVKSEVRSQK